jgi:hypothetical protein
MTMTDQHLFKPTERTLRQFAVMWIIFFTAIAAWQELHHHRHVVAMIVGSLALTVGALGVAWPMTIRPIFVAWMTMAYPIGWTVTRIVLGAVFYVLFTPIAWIFRLIGRDELGLKATPEAATYWESKPRVVDKVRYLRQF